MKKFAISLIALAAISTASFAGSRSYDLRESDTYFGKYSEQLMNRATDAEALVFIKKAKAAANFERQSWIAEENDNGRHWSKSRRSCMTSPTRICSNILIWRDSFSAR